MNKKPRIGIVLVIIAAMVMTGCSGKKNGQTGDDNIAADNSAASGTSDQAAGSSDNGSNTAEKSTGEGSANYGTSKVVVDKEFTAKDLEVGYEESTATHISLSNNAIDINGDGAEAADGVLTILQKGTYVLTGTLTDGQIVVNAGEMDKIHLIFNGINVTCSDHAAVYIKNADKVFITLVKDTINTLADGKEYALKDEDNADGVIFSKADLTLNGYGTLNITGNYKHGIASKDDLVITSGIYNIAAVKDALNGKDCVKIKDGTFQLISTTGNGIQSKNKDDNTKGYVYIAGGNITVLQCREGIEATVIVIEEGVIMITAQDDGLNAASASSTSQVPADTTSKATVNSEGEGTPDGLMRPEGADSPDRLIPTEKAGAPNGFDRRGFGGGAFDNDTNCFILITGGTLKVNAGGDGIDSNGSLAISGGNIMISGPTNSGNGALDYTGTADISGGTAVIVGSLGMAQGFSDTSTQYSLSYGLTSVSPSGTELTLTDPDGKVIVSYTPDKEYQSIVISSPELMKEVTYTLISGNQTAEVTLTAIATSAGQQGRGFGGMGGHGFRGQKGLQRPSGN